MTISKLTFTLLLLAGLLVFASGCPQSGGEQKGTAAGPAGSTGSATPPAPKYPAATDFTFAKFDGSNGKMSSYKGKPLVINFWATW